MRRRLLPAARWIEVGFVQARASGFAGRFGDALHPLGRRIIVIGRREATFVDLRTSGIVRAGQPCRSTVIWRGIERLVASG